MGRNKIDITFIQEPRKRQVTLNKRKTGLIKKAYELSVLCGCEVALVVRDEKNQSYLYGSEDANATFQRQLDSNEQPCEMVDNEAVRRKVECGHYDNESGTEDAPQDMSSEPSSAKASTTLPHLAPTRTKSGRVSRPRGSKFSTVETKEQSPQTSRVSKTNCGKSTKLTTSAKSSPRRAKRVRGKIRCGPATNKGKIKASSATLCSKRKKVADNQEFVRKQQHLPEKEPEPDRSETDEDVMDDECQSQDKILHGHDGVREDLTYNTSNEGNPNNRFEDPGCAVRQSERWQHQRVSSANGHEHDQNQTTKHQRSLPLSGHHLNYISDLEKMNVSLSTSHTDDSRHENVKNSISRNSFGLKCEEDESVVPDTDHDHDHGRRKSSREPMLNDHDDDTSWQSHAVDMTTQDMTTQDMMKQSDSNVFVSSGSLLLNHKKRESNSRNRHRPNLSVITPTSSTMTIPNGVSMRTSMTSQHHPVMTADQLNAAWLSSPLKPPPLPEDFVSSSTSFVNGVKRRVSLPSDGVRHSVASPTLNSMLSDMSTLSGPVGPPNSFLMGF